MTKPYDRTCEWCGKIAPDSETALIELRPVTMSVMLCYTCKPKMETTTAKLLYETHAKILELSDLMWSLVGTGGKVEGGVSEDDWSRITLFATLLTSMAKGAENMLLKHMPPEINQRAADIIVDQLLESPPDGMTLPQEGVQVMTMRQFIDRNLN